MKTLPALSGRPCPHRRSLHVRIEPEIYELLAAECPKTSTGRNRGMGYVLAKCVLLVLGRKYYALDGP